MPQSDSVVAVDCQEDQLLERDSAKSDYQHDGNETCLEREDFRRVRKKNSKYCNNDSGSEGGMSIDVKEKTKAFKKQR